MAKLPSSDADVNAIGFSVPVVKNCKIAPISPSFVSASSTFPVTLKDCAVALIAAAAIRKRVNNFFILFEEILSR